MKPPPRKMVLWTLLMAAFCVWAAWGVLRPGRGPVPLAASSQLRDVVEPITIVDGVSFDDGGSRGLRFQDARGTIKDLCLIVFGFENPEPPPVVAIDSFTPTRNPVPISGIDQRALLGLLERWAAADLDARELQRRYDLHESGRLTTEEFWVGLPSDSRVKQTAVSIPRTLRSRN